MISESSSIEAPKAKSERTNISKETDLLPASSLAIRLWLEPIFVASCFWVRLFLFRLSLTLRLRANLNSIYVSSSGESPKNSETEPIFQSFCLTLWGLVCFISILARSGGGSSAKASFVCYMPNMT